MMNLKNEIRINSKYTNLYRSEYKDSILNNDSLPVIHKKSLLTIDYLKRIALTINDQSMNVLPPNCRFMERVQGGYIIAIEEPPAFRTIKIDLNFQRETNILKRSGRLEKYDYSENFTTNIDEVPSFNLAFPYVIFILYIDDFYDIRCGQAFLRVARLTGLSDYLLKIPLPNISESQYICFGTKSSGISESLNAAVEKAINVFWGAEFNNDYMYNYHAYEKVAGVSTYMEWQGLSKLNPMFIYNVDWIKIPMNFGQAIDEIKRHNNKTTKQVEYKSLTQMFSTKMDTGKVAKPTKRAKKKYKLYYDVAEGVFLDNKFYIHVGDPFLIKNNKRMCYINSLISFENSGGIKYFRVEREDGRLIIYKNTKAFSKFLKEKTIELRYEKEGTLKNGDIVKKDDIVQMKNGIGNTVYKKVGYIRLNQEGYHEACFGDGFYILEHLEAKVYNLSNPVYNGLKLTKDKTYLFINGATNETPLLSGYLVKYDDFNVDHTDRLKLQFRSIDDNLNNDYFRINIDSTIHNSLIFDTETIKPLPPLVRVGRTLIMSRRNTHDPMEGTTFGTPNGVAIDNRYQSAAIPSPLEIKKYILNDDKFRVESYDMNIDFAIGDKVVTSDWENPINMLSIKIIQGFKFNEERGDIHFILADKEGILHQIKYVDGPTGSIFTGKIRHITNVYGNLTAGMKIQAQETGILHFLKKDTHIIIGFITDTGGSDPLVLCSNCCTLWYSDVINKFKKISMTNKKWATISHAPIDIAKIKFQPGDIIVGENEYQTDAGCIVFKINGNHKLNILDLKYYTRIPRYTLLDKYTAVNYKFDYILNPRISQRIQNEIGTKRGWTNCHGHTYTCNSSIFEFINDERSMINV